MKTVCGSIAVALALIGSPATAQAEEPASESLQAFLPECDLYLDDCRNYTIDFIQSMLDIQSNPDPACVPAPIEAADMILARLREYARVPVEAKEPHEEAMTRAVIEVFSCLKFY
ncbi:MAG: hypothetical protein U0942_02990 [Parvibaculum sp.]|uniref:hypothetical protein n=1 Tax=Parvibaculum sp. TaxID=2024848 RepID=UPI002ABC4F8D|nr:hypothetical protein [Parvibaculum sp.]MDZ4380286.1 hypothetical protein [Parvibaculum sp.]